MINTLPAKIIEEKKKAIIGAVCTIGNTNAADILFTDTREPAISHITISHEKKTRNKIELPNFSTEEDFKHQTRGAADIAACFYRYHTVDTAQADKQRDQWSRILLNKLEEIRCLSLGASDMPGMLTNYMRFKIPPLIKGSDLFGEKLSDKLVEYTIKRVNEVLFNFQYPINNKQCVPSPLVTPLEQQIHPHIQSLNATRHNQKLFTQTCYLIINVLENILSNNDYPGHSPAGLVDKVKDIFSSLLERTEPDTDAENQEASELPPTKIPDTSPSARRLPTQLNSAFDYKIYQTAFDEQLHPQQLLTTAQLNALRVRLDRLLADLPSDVRKEKKRLHRYLLSLQKRQWQFDLEEGQINSAYLSRVLTSPNLSTLYKMETENDFSPAVVTLLIDNSKSMQGPLIEMAAMCADLLSGMLEYCGVTTEILGFTTVDNENSRVHQQWINKGKPENPGRLNATRHIIYKSADQSWRRSKKNLGLMLNASILKENIDGEALMWAATRLLKRPEKRKFLMVLSDGSPSDQDTCKASGPRYLEAHTHKVIDWVENQTNIYLSAIGIGHDVTRYYKHCVSIHDLKDLTATLFKQMSELFKTSASDTSIR